MHKYLEHNILWHQLNINLMNSIRHNTFSSIQNMRLAYVYMILKKSHQII